MCGGVCVAMCAQLPGRVYTVYPLSLSGAVDLPVHLSVYASPCLSFSSLSSLSSLLCFVGFWGLFIFERDVWVCFVD